MASASTAVLSAMLKMLSKETRKSVKNVIRRLRDRGLDLAKCDQLGYNRYRVNRGESPVSIYLGKGRLKSERMREDLT